MTPRPSHAPACVTSSPPSSIACRVQKKNQELEKFKFVLDYKIKELKTQIEPRENEIAAMKRQARGGSGGEAERETVAMTC